VILEVYFQDAVDDLDPDLVADLGVDRTDGYGFFVALVEVEVDAAGYLDTVEALGSAFLGMAIVDDLFLGDGEGGCEDQSREE
jgi:hypothetical protein